ncbi:GAF domain-containing protein [Brucella thiophenivorans]|uniref:Bacterial transcriptional regulator family protein n=1 Tax=Brucella thiophenivorans TaxID=571255 RepID=A0A256FZ52_9HYPH|nr:GAF domain-containing protein [Brucella thiophenivorans]OYR20000.1 bacterial transcriptional regulator family protein [Brucella thiophenivorans]
MGAPQDRIHADRIHSEIETGGAARSALVASWRRSARLYGLDPAEVGSVQTLSDHELRTARQRMERVISIAQASMDRLYMAVGGVGCCVLLADSQGVPVERRGAAGDDDTFYDWGLWTGAVWSEAVEGTNGIGTCIAEQRALTIHRDQHFHTRNIGLSCTVAPIHDHQGRIMAALDVSSCRSDLTEAFVQLISVAVIDAARRIEAENFRQAFPDARIVLAPSADRTGGALIAVDKDDFVIGATRAARLSLDLTDEALSTALPAADLLGWNADPREDMAESERSVILRAIARSEGNVSSAAKLLGISRATLHRKLNRLKIIRAH